MGVIMDQMQNNSQLQETKVPQAPKQLSKYSRYKQKNIRLAAILRDMGMEHRSNNVYNCCRVVQTTPDGEIAKVYMCHDRFCPICMRAKSRKITNNVNDIIKSLPENQKYVFIGLTIPNIPGDCVRDAFKMMTSAFNVVKTKWYREGHISGYIRSFEITYNRKEHTWHPHFHILAACDNELFSLAEKIQSDLKIKRDYLHMMKFKTLENGEVKPIIPKTGYSDDLDEFRLYWQRCFYHNPELEVPQGTAYWQCDIKPVYPDENQEQGKYYKAAAEVSKYMFKLSEEQFEAENLITLITALRSMQQFSFSGCFRSLSKSLKEETEDENTDCAKWEISANYMQVPLYTWYWWSGLRNDWKFTKEHLTEPCYYFVNCKNYGFTDSSQALQSRINRVSYSYYLKEGKKNDVS